MTTDLYADTLHSDGLPETPVLRKPFEDLTLLELLPQLIQHPIRTTRALGEVLSRVPEDRLPADVSYPSPLVAIRKRKITTIVLDRAGVQLLASFGVVLLVALIGSYILTTARDAQNDNLLNVGGPLLLVAMFATAGIALRSLTLPRLAPLELPETKLSAFNTSDFIERYGIRLALFGMALLWTGGAWIFNVDNTFTIVGVICWIMSILTWIGALMDHEVKLLDLPTVVSNRIVSPFRQGITAKFSWTLVALIVILLIGGWFRFSNLGAYPPEMTSDHVEKLLDTQKVLDGERAGGRSIFFPNNGGREVFQMYYLAVLHTITKIPVNFDLLKLGSGIEGMVMILVAFWMGRTIIGDEDRELGNLTGVIMAAFVASSYWHTLLSRLGLRIVTTTIMTGLLLIFLTRALRYNRRSDFLISGFILGAGMYFYQAMRMLPVVVIVGVILALIIRARSGRAIRAYIVNAVALVIISLVVFVPLGHYSVQYPEAFWERTSGRLFGEDTLKDEVTGEPIVNPTFQDRLSAFNKNIPVLADNIKNSLLMFNWKGDRAWFNGDPAGAAELDFFAGALFVMGLGLIVARMIRRHDPVDWLLPISIPILLLSTALSIAYTIEVPSSTRASASFPIVYLIAALPLAVIVQLLLRYIPPSRLRIGLLAIPVVLFTFGSMMNADTYFGEAMPQYRQSTLPHKQVGQALKGFAASTGGSGNAFMIAYPYWMDHRAIALEADDITWDNTIPGRDQIDQQIYNKIRVNMGTKYEFKPDRQVMFFVHQEDSLAVTVLSAMFPKGVLIRVPSYNKTRDFQLFIAPPPGCNWMAEQIGMVPLSCGPQEDGSGGIMSPDGQIQPGLDNGQQ